MATPAGIALAVAAACSLAVMSVSVRLASKDGRIYDVLLVVLGVNLAVLVPVTVVLHYPDFGLTPASVVAFSGAGLTGTFLARMLFFASIDRIGASRSEPIKASQPLHASLIAVLVLGESLTPGHLFGIVLIVAGVAVISWETATTRSRTSNFALWDLAFPLGAAFLFGLEPTLVKLGYTEGTPVLVSLLVKVLAGGTAFIGYLWWRGELRRENDAAPSALKWHVGAGIGSTTFLLAYYTSLQMAPVVLVVPIIQTSPLLVAGLSYLYLQGLERITRRLVAGSVIVVLGAMLVTTMS